MGRKIRTLIIEDRDDDCQLVLHELRKGGFDPEHQRIETSEALRSALEQPWDIAISDFHMPRFTGIEAVRQIRESGSDLPFILVSGTIGESYAVEAMKSGANDYIMKGNLTRLVPAVERELREAGNRRELLQSLRRTEQSLREAQKMEAVGRLAGGIAHDFNNILAIILLYVEAILEDTNPGQEVASRTQAIQRAAEKGANLVKKLLVFSKTQLPTIRLMNINEVLRDFEVLLRKLISEQTEMVLELEPELGQIEIDPVHLEQVIMNLVANAAHAMAQGGTLTIRTKRIGMRALLEIQDTGCGMDEATRERIFEPFFTTKPEGQGTGLGLATVYAVMQRCHGTIEVQSELGKGSRFRLFFTISQRSEEPFPLPEPAEAGVQASETVLLIEDDESLREVMRSTLQREGYRVFDAPNAEAASLVAFPRMGEIDLLITDAILPGINGVEFFNQLAGIRPDLKVLFLSGYSDRVAFDRLEKDKQRFLAKPFTAATFLGSVREILG